MEAGTATPSLTQSIKKAKTLNNSTYKLHSLGDYARMIRTHGTTDSYSTQMVGGTFIAYLFCRAHSMLNAGRIRA